MRFDNLLTFLLLALVLLLAPGCRRDRIRRYRVSKEIRKPAPAAAGPALDWHAPQAWASETPGPAQLARFRIDGSDNSQAVASITALTGEAGGLLANVNRWRTQLGLEAATETDSVTEKVATGVGQALLVSLTGEPAGEKAGRAMLVAVLPHEGETWFFKIVGDGKVVEAARPGLLTMLTKLHPRGGGH